MVSVADAPDKLGPAAGALTIATEWAGYEWRPGRAVAGTTVGIEHCDHDLLDRFVGSTNRRLRLMAWTTQNLPGHPRQLGARWTRITIDELVYEQTRRWGNDWMSVLSSIVFSPIVDFTDPPHLS